MKRVQKILIIGLDGANWTILDEKVLKGHMPNLNRLVSEGTSGVLFSTDPPNTPAAWTTCLTGCNPGRHGLIGWEAYSIEENRVYLVNSTHRRLPTMWNYFSEAGLRVGSVCVPFTWPTEPINGIMVAGYGCPDTETTFTYPEEFGAEILRVMPDFTPMYRHPMKIGLGRESLEVVSRGIAEAARSFEQRTSIAAMVCERIDPDVLFVQFQDLDWLQHALWQYMDPATRDRYPAFRDAFFGLYRKLDDNIAELLRLVGEDALVVVVSDHGLGPLHWSINANLLLLEWGYLKRESRIQKMVRRIRRRWNRLRGRKKYTLPVDLRMPVDWARTRAAVIVAATYGRVHLNVKGRQRQGCVTPGKEYEALLEELRHRFSELVNPETGEVCFERVVRPKEIWGADVEDLDSPGDLILVSRPDYTIYRSLRPRPLISPVPHGALQAKHRREGIFAFYGPGVRSSSTLDANIADIYPTITAALGLAVPEGLDGRPLTEVFAEPIEVQRARGGSVPPSGGPKNLSEEEERKIRQRLKGLGYID